MTKRFIGQVKIILIVIPVVLLLAGCSSQPELISVNINPEIDNLKATTSASITATGQNKPKIPTTTVAASKAASQQVQVPKSFELDVPFTSQAPLANWDALHEEACEEASMIMAFKYFNHQPLNDQIAEQEIQKIIAWETERGYKVDLTAEQTVKILHDYYNLPAQVTRDVNVDRIKYELSRGNLIIVPAAGRELNNPNFKQPGPIYHMLVIKGYNDKEFIVNDPGTRRGNGYKYSYQTLLGAVHDWNQQLADQLGGMTEENMVRGQKVLVIVSQQ